jgi:4,5-dihydroxyphthalate decarboxylase
MLINGEIDVMLSTAQSTLPSLPDSSHRKDLWGDSHVRKLFTKPLDEAKRYYAKSGFIPVNHTIVIKQQIVKNHPWVPLTLLKAFEESKKISLNRINRLVQSNLVEARVIIDEQRRIFGEDPFPYGFEQNRAPLDTLSRYLIDQSLIPEPFSWEEHFADTTLES